MPTFTEDQQQDKLNPGQQHADQEFGSRHGTLDPDAIEQQEQGAGAATDVPSDEEMRQLTGIGAGQEKAIDKSAGKGGDFTFNDNDNEPTTRGQKAKNFLKKRKLLLLGGGSILSMIALVLFIIFILGSLPLTTTAVLLERQLDRALRDSANSSEQVVEEKVAADSMSDSESAQLSTEVNRLNDTGLKEDLSALSPGKAVDKLIKGMKVNYDPNPRTIAGIGRQRAVSIELNGKVIDLPANTTPVVGKLTPTYIRNKLDTSSGIKNVVRQSLLDESSSGGWASLYKRIWLASGKGARAINAVIDAQKYRWTTKELVEAQQSKQAADRVNAQESYKESTDNGNAATEAEQGASDDVKQVVETAANQEQACFADNTCTDQVVAQGGGEPANVVQTISKGFDPSILQKVFGKLNTAWIILAPLCAIYQNSVVNSGGVIDANSNSAMRTYFSAESAASQQNYNGTGGASTVNGQAIGGYTDQMTDLTKSNTYKASNNDVVDTTNTPSAQASAGGTYSYSAFSFLPAGVAGVLDTIASPLCAIFGNPWTGGAILGAQVAVNLIPGIGEVIAGGGDITAQFIARSVAIQMGQAIKKFLTPKELLKFGGLAGATELGSILGHLIALQHMAAPNNGTSHGTPYLDSGDMGGNLYGNEIDRRQTYAAPLDNTGVNQVKTADAAFNSQNNSEKSPYERYLALDNPQSLLVHMATTVGGHLNLSSLASLFSVPARIFNFSFVSQLGTMFHPSVASAISARDTTDYDIVQWGWTPDEENTYENDPNYEMIHNEQVLENSGKKQEISDKYSKCFTETMGQLLSAGDIRRDETTHAVLDGADQGDCSPTNLGMHNPTYGDLVFRWRIAQRNDTALHEIVNMQNATNVQS